jgi:hypothetical protein
MRRTEKKKRPNKFRDYLDSKEISTEDAAKQLDITASYVNGLSSGAQTPGLKLAVKIQLWSKDAVPVTSWTKK